MNIDIRDVVGGGVLFVTGAAAVFYSMTHYGMGTTDQLDSGVFPAISGGILALSGLAILLPALAREGEEITIEWQALAVICAALLSFALTAPSLGIVPALTIMIVISTFAGGWIGFLRTLALVVVLVSVSAFIFIYLLKVQFKLFWFYW